MLLGSVQIAGEELSILEIKDICESLNNDSIRLLSLRGCRMDDSCFQKLTESLKGNDSLVQLNLNLGVVNSKDRIRWLTEGLIQNDSLTSLLYVFLYFYDCCFDNMNNIWSPSAVGTKFILGGCPLFSFSFSTLL